MLTVTLVPAAMKYEDWREEFVKDGLTEGAESGIITDIGGDSHARTNTNLAGGRDYAGTANPGGSESLAPGAGEDVGGNVRFPGYSAGNGDDSVAGGSIVGSVLENRSLVVLETEPDLFVTRMNIALPDIVGADKVTPHSADEWADARATLYSGIGWNGRTGKQSYFGGAVLPNKDIEGVFSAVAGGGKATVVELIHQGGNRLDAYAYNAPLSEPGGLHVFYSKFGFVPVARVRFNPAFVPEGFVEENGELDILFYVYRGGDPATIEERLGTFHVATAAEIEALPIFEGEDAYDNARVYRDSLLDK